MSNLPSTDVKSVQEMVKEKLQGQIAGLIPDNVWTEMIESECNRLLSLPQKVTDPFTNQVVELTRLQYLIRQELYSYLKSKIHEEIKSPDFAINSVYDGQSYILTNERISQAIEHAAPNLLQILVTQLFTQVSLDIMNKLRNGY